LTEKVVISCYPVKRRIRRRIKQLVGQDNTVELKAVRRAVPPREIQLVNHAEGLTTPRFAG